MFPQQGSLEFEDLEFFDSGACGFFMPQVQALFLQQQHCWPETVAGAGIVYPALCSIGCETLSINDAIIIPAVLSIGAEPFSLV